MTTDIKVEREPMKFGHYYKAVRYGRMLHNVALKCPEARETLLKMIERDNPNGAARMIIMAEFNGLKPKNRLKKSSTMLYNAMMNAMSLGLQSDRVYFINQLVRREPTPQQIAEHIKIVETACRLGVDSAIEQYLQKEKN